MKESGPYSAERPVSGRIDGDRQPTILTDGGTAPGTDNEHNSTVDSPAERPPIWERTGVSVPQLLLVGLFAVLVIALLVVGSTSTAAFGLYNPDWEGTAEFRALADDRSTLVVATGTERYETVDPNATVAIVTAPDAPYEHADAERLGSFVEAGGTLVVAENFGPHGNGLLASIGAETRFDRTLVRDERNHFRSPAMPIADGVGTHSLVDDVDAVTMNYGTVLDPGPEASIALNTSEFAYLDHDGDGELGDEQDVRRYPVVATEPIDNGTVVAVSDPSIFVNAMLEETDNRQFATNVIEATTVSTDAADRIDGEAGLQTEIVLVDVSHADAQPPLVALLIVIQETPLVAAIVGLLGIGAVIGASRWRSIGESLRRRYDRVQAVRELETIGRADPAAIETALRERHPEWDDDRIERVATDLLAHHPQSGSNE